MAQRNERYTLIVHSENGSLWAEVEELPGVFASGDNEDELIEAVAEAICMYLSTGDERVRITDIRTEDVSREVTLEGLITC